MKRKKTKVKGIISCFIAITLLFANSTTFISSAYGADIGNLNSCMVYIRNVNSGKYIDVQGGTVANGKEVQLYEGVSSAAQRWNIVKESGVYYSIRSAINQRYFLSVKGDKDVNGAKIALKYVPSGSAVPDSALFMIFDLPDTGCAFLINKLNFVNQSTELRGLDAQQAGTANGTKILQYSLRDTLDKAAHQLWVFESVNRTVKTLTWNLVDIGGHCDWDGTTKYMSQFNKAINAWNSYMGTERFRPDAWNRIEDVRISDAEINNDSKSVCGITDPNGSIVFYTKPMEALNSDLERQFVIMHELGHALGLGHSPPNKTDPELGNTMNPFVKAYGYTLSLDDKASYQAASKKYGLF